MNVEQVPVVVVTNQSGVARGLLTEENLLEINARMIQLLGSEGARLDGVYYCPHHPDFGPPRYRIDCHCRKPATGMLERASDDLGIDLSSSYVVGDKMTDVMFAKNAGCKSVLVMTGFGRSELVRAGSSTVESADFIADDLLDAVNWIVENIAPHRDSNQ